ncbi:MAG: hypothetical protein RR475_06285 [Clostridia bacterium]
MHDGHDHTHTHPHTDEVPNLAETTALLKFMLEHNVHHTEELNELAGKLDALDLHDSAHNLLHCVEDYQKGNERLSQVIASMK